MQTIEPVVSIIIITYNSSRCVLETLDSIKKQTYKKLELIISDDCSTDSTIEVCTDFIRQNSSIDFIRNAKIVATDKNSGITPNYNNGLKYATGEWVKFIAGDDILDPNCIKEYTKFVSEKNNLYIVVSGTRHFYTMIPLQETFFPVKLRDADVRNQLKQMIKEGTIIEGPTLFLKRKKLLELGCFDVKYPMLEDYPIVMKYLANGYKVGCMDGELVRYRVHQESVSRNIIYGSKFTPSIFSAIEDFAIPKAKEQGMYLHWYHLVVTFWISRNASKGFLYKVCGYLMRSIDVINYRNKFKQERSCFR